VFEVREGFLVLGGLGEGNTDEIGFFARETRKG